MLRRKKNTKPPLHVICIGEIDHGKSTLIGRLLLDSNSLSPSLTKNLKRVTKELGGEIALTYVCDQLKEEREQGITIDTTQQLFSSKSREYVIIDVPGHLKFIKNMLTGATSADAAVLVVDATAGMQPQSQRHAALCQLLGIPELIIAVTKMDAIAYDQGRFCELCREIEKCQLEAPLADLKIVPTSASDGAQICKRDSRLSWYQGPTLVEALDAAKGKSRRESASLCMPIQDVYQIESESISVGKVLSGKIVRGQTARICPGGQTVTIQKILESNQCPQQVQAGYNVGLSLQTADDKEYESTRGQILLALQSDITTQRRFSATLFWLDENPLRKNAIVTLRCCTQEIEVKLTTIVRRLDSSTLETIEESAAAVQQNEVAEVEFLAATPIVLSPFHSFEELGRFVIESDFEANGLGIVTQTESPIELAV